MTNRKRFHLALKQGAPDRIPLLSEGIREDTIHLWREQGLGRRALSSVVKSDPHELIGPELDPIPYPALWPEDKTGLEKLSDALDPYDRRRYPPRWKHKYRSLISSDTISILCVHQGLFLSMGVNGWDRFDSVIELLLSNPDLVRAQMEIYAEFAVGIIDNVLTNCTVDAVYFSEPIGGNDQPLVAPKLYRDLMLKSYLPIIAAVKKFGIDNIIYLTYGNISPLLGDVIDTGFTCLWACETSAAAMDYRAIRKEFGSGLGLIGGIDLDALRQGKMTIERELEIKLPELLKDGNYLPLADGRIRTDIPFQNYMFYREKLASMVNKG